MSVRNSVLKYTKLKDAIIASIAKERYRPGDRIPGVRELMQEYQVSANTLSHALSLLTRDGIIERRHGSGLYVRSREARSARTVGFILTEAENPFLNRFLQALTSMKDRYDVNIITKISAFDPIRERNAAETLVSAGAQGIFILPEPKGVNRRFFEGIAERGVPVINVIRAFDAGTMPACIPDNHAVGRIAAKHLISAGCRSIVYIGNRHFRRNNARFEGFIAEAKAQGVELSRRRIIFTETENSVEAGRRSFEKALSQCSSIDGVFAFHDLFAAGVLRACMKNGKRVPDDVRIIGCDDLDIASCLTPSLTSINTGIDAIASEALVILNDMLAKKNVLSYTAVPRLVIRESA